MTHQLKRTLLIITFLLGYTNLSYELIILRQLVNFLGSNTLITSIIMACILLFLSVGYYFGSVIRFNRYPVRRLIQRWLWILAGWYMISSAYIIISLFFIIFYPVVKSPFLLTFIFCGLFLILPAVAGGFVTASLGRIINHNNSDYTGRFMAIDTMGSVLGSLLTTLFFMSYFGVSRTIFILVALTGLSAYFLTRRKDLFYNTVIFILLLGCSFSLNYLRHADNTQNLIKDDALSRMEITSSDNGLSRTLLINGQLASKISDDRDLMFSYMKFINTYVIDNLPKDKTNRILVLGGGGFTVGIDDTRNDYTFLDIERNLKKVSEESFLKSPLPPNKKFIAQDAYLYMLHLDEKFDVIVLDVYSSVHSIPLDFVSRDFLLQVKKHLNPDGIMVANIITSADFSNKFARRIDNTLRSVFPQYLTRQVIDPDPKTDLSNVIYIYYNRPPDNTVYTIDKNAAMYGQF